jgi:hypothetical protein
MLRSHKHGEVSYINFVHIKFHNGSKFPGPFQKSTPGVVSRERNLSISLTYIDRNRSVAKDWGVV